MNTAFGTPGPCHPELPFTIRLAFWAACAFYVAHSFHLGGAREILGLAKAGPYTSSIHPGKVAFDLCTGLFKFSVGFGIESKIIDQSERSNPKPQRNMGAVILSTNHCTVYNRDTSCQH